MRHPAGDQCIDVGAPDADQPRADPDALARDWEWQQVSDLAAGQALVLLYVAERADGTGHCFRHARTTAAALPLTEGSTAQRLKELARMGILTRQCAAPGRVLHRPLADPTHDAQRTPQFRWAGCRESHAQLTLEYLPS